MVLYTLMVFHSQLATSTMASNVHVLAKSIKNPSPTSANAKAQKRKIHKRTSTQARKHQSTKDQSTKNKSPNSQSSKVNKLKVHKLTSSQVHKLQSPHDQISQDQQPKRKSKSAGEGLEVQVKVVQVQVQVQVQAAFLCFAARFVVVLVCLRTWGLLFVVFGTKSTDPTHIQQPGPLC
jgi:cobalamin biosynthesis Mg chelatase CobN